MLAAATFLDSLSWFAVVGLGGLAVAATTAFTVDWRRKARARKRARRWVWELELVRMRVKAQLLMAAESEDLGSITESEADALRELSPADQLAVVLVAELAPEQAPERAPEQAPEQASDAVPEGHVVKPGDTPAPAGQPDRARDARWAAFRTANRLLEQRGTAPPDVLARAVDLVVRDARPAGAIGSKFAAARVQLGRTPAAALEHALNDVRVQWAVEHQAYRTELTSNQELLAYLRAYDEIVALIGSPRAAAPRDAPRGPAFPPPGGPPDAPSGSAPSDAPYPSSQEPPDAPPSGAAPASD